MTNDTHHKQEFQTYGHIIPKYPKVTFGSVWKKITQKVHRDTPRLKMVDSWFMDRPRDLGHVDVHEMY